jgi:hypothetical protein
MIVAIIVTIMVLPDISILRKIPWEFNYADSAISERPGGDCLMTPANR